MRRMSLKGGAGDSPAFRNLRSLLNLVRPDAGRARPQPSTGPIHNRAHALQVDVPAALGHVMGVADLIAELRPAAAYVAYLCHKTGISPILQNAIIPGGWSALQPDGIRSLSVPASIQFGNCVERFSAHARASDTTCRRALPGALCIRSEAPRGSLAGRGEGRRRALV